MRTKGGKCRIGCCKKQRHHRPFPNFLEGFNDNFISDYRLRALRYLNVKRREFNAAD